MMVSKYLWTAGMICLLFAGRAPAGEGSQEGEDLETELETEHGHAPVGETGGSSWLEPWPHDHFSGRGTPYVHIFGFEPAFLGRAGFLDYRSARGSSVDERELGVELEWAFTRRLGLVVEAPYIRLEEDGGSSESGVGDIALAPRALLVESDPFLLSGNLEFSFPTGDERVGLGSGEVGLAPSLSAWFDLGHWVQLNAQLGTEFGMESGDAEAFYGGALVYSFLTRERQGHTGHGHRHPGRHLPAGMVSAILELTGATVLDGEDEGYGTAEALFGLSYMPTSTLELRAAYQIPVGRDQEFDRAFILSLVRHL